MFSVFLMGFCFLLLFMMVFATPAKNTQRGEPADGTEESNEVNKARQMEGRMGERRVTIKQKPKLNDE